MKKSKDYQLRAYENYKERRHKRGDIKFNLWLDSELKEEVKLFADKECGGLMSEACRTLIWRGLGKDGNDGNR